MTSILQKALNVKRNRKNNSGDDIRWAKKEKEPTLEENAAYEAYQAIFDAFDEEFTRFYSGGAYDGARLKKNLEKQIFDELVETMEYSDRRRAADYAADKIMQATVIEHHIDHTLKESVLHELQVLSAYRGKLDLSSIREELKYIFGDDYRKVAKRWGTSEYGMKPDAIVSELAERLGHQISIEHPAEVVVMMENEWQSLRGRLDHETMQQLKSALNSEDYERIRARISNVIFDKMNDIQYDVAAADAIKVYNQAIKAGQQRARQITMEERKRLSADYKKKVIAAYGRAQKRIDKERASMREQLRKMRQQRDEKIAEAKQEKWEGIAKARQQRDEKIAEAKTEAREYVQKGTEKINEKADVIHWRHKANAIMLGIRNWNTSELKAPSQIDNRRMLDALTDLNRVVRNDDISDRGTRSAMRIVLEWYRTEGVQERFLGVTKDETGKVIKEGYYSETIEEFIEELATGKGKLKLEELKSLCEVLGSLKKVIAEAHKVRVDGKLEDIMKVGREYEDVAKKSKANFHAKGLRGLIDKWMVSYNDPMTLMRFLDSYAEKGLATDMLKEFRKANTEYDYIKYGLDEEVRKFEREHKGYFDRMAKRTVKLHVNELEYILPADEAMRIHEQLLTDDGLSHILLGGTEYRTTDGKIRYIDGFAQTIRTLDEKQRKDPDLVEAKYQEMREAAKPFIEAIERELTDEDIAFIRLSEKLFNEECKELKRATDEDIYGWSNVMEGKYFPLGVADVAQKMDASDFFSGIDRATNASFNKSRALLSTARVRAGGLSTVLSRHIDGIARYAAMGETIMTFEKLLYTDLRRTWSSDDYDKTLRVQTNRAPDTLNALYKQIWEGYPAYMRKLISDMQKIPTGEQRTTGVEMFDYVRGKYAVAVLGLNPKVWATQFSSLFASTAILDSKYVVRGFMEKVGDAGYADLDNYCHLAMLRNADNTAVRAQTVTDKISKAGEFCTKMIGITDRCVIGKLWNACLHQTAAENHIKIDSEENKQRAGELLARVIYETQQNAQATEKSAAMRSNSHFLIHPSCS